MESGAFLIINVVLGLLATLVALNKGRSGVGWFFGGFFLGIIGVILVLCLPNLVEQQEKEARQETENRRLREQLRQEKLKGEAFRQHAALRLDAHDNRLGMDTRSLAALPDSAAPPTLRRLQGPPPLPTSSPDLPDDSVPDEAGSVKPEMEAPDAAGATHAESLQNLWYYSEAGEAKGPVNPLRIRRLLENGKLASSTLLWRRGLTAWTPVTEIPAFKRFLPS